MNDSKYCFLCDRWIDQELSETERIGFEAHLENCAACRLRLEQWRDVELDMIAAFGFFEPAMLEVSHGNRLPPARLRTVTRSRFVMGAIAAALLVVITISWIAWQRPSNSDPFAIQLPEPLEPSSESLIPDDTISDPNPAISVKIIEPIISSRPVTTSRFTVVQVYPVFSPYDPDENN